MTNTPISFPIKLIDGWLHPLSEFPVIEGMQMTNDWAFASMICSTASERFPGYSDKNEAIEMLFDLGVIRKATEALALSAASTDDHVYLGLIILTHDAINNRAVKAFNIKG